MTLARTPMKRARPRPSVTPEAKAALTERSGGWCEARLSGCDGRAADACHRISRKAGGRQVGEHEGLANLWHGCRSCHRWATARPTEAYDLGLALKEWQDPEREPMSYRGLCVLLGDDGTLTEVAA